MRLHPHPWRPALTALLCVLGLALTGCDEALPTVSGFSLNQLFPERTDQFWKYDNDDSAQITWWRNLGNTSPAGEAWMTWRIYTSAEQDFLEAVNDGDDPWDVELYFANRATGFEIVGWDASGPGGTYASLGTELFDGAGVPLAPSGVSPQGETRTVTAAGREWTVVYAPVPDALEFNAQRYQDYWDITISSDAADTPIEGTWSMTTGVIFQYDLDGFVVDGGTDAPWQLIHSAPWSEVTGATR